MSFLIAIRQWLVSIANFFYSLYAEVSGWIWPFNKIAGLFYSIGTFFDNLTWEFYLFDVWLQGVWSQLSQFISWSALQSWFNQFLNMITGAWNWVANWWSNVWSAINSWWPTVIPTIQSWISSATQGLSGLLADFLNFTKNILPTLMTIAQWTFLWPLKLLEITGLINSAFIIRGKFWEGWQDVRDNVVKFISNPLDWLLDHFTDWFLGKE